MLESNIEEEETSKSRKEKPSYFIFTSCSCSGRAFTHIFTCSCLRSCLCLYSVPYKYLSIMQLRSTIRRVRTLSEQLSSDLCFPAERIHYLEGAIELTMPKHTTLTVENTKRNLGSSDIMDDNCSQKMQPFYGRWKQDKSCSPGSPTLIPDVILHYISAARKAFAIEPLMSQKQRFFKASEYESGAHQWDGITEKVSKWISEWDSLKTSRTFVFTHLCIV